jgi:two-component system cell cycle response regulator DivK
MAVMISPALFTQTSRAIRVLVVEDDPNSRWLLCTLLKRMGFECRSAEDGQEALALVRSFTPEVIVMDLMLPVLDGLAATKQLKSDAATQNIPILALSADATDAGFDAARKAGCDDFMPKPVVLDALIHWVREHARP